MVDVGYLQSAWGAAVSAEATLGARGLPHAAILVGATAQYDTRPPRPSWRQGGFGILTVGWQLPVARAWTFGPRAALEYATFFPNEDLGGYTSVSLGVEVRHATQSGRSIREWAAYVGWGGGTYHGCLCGWEFAEASFSVRLAGGWVLLANASFSRLGVGFGWEWTDGGRE